MSDVDGWFISGVFHSGSARATHLHSLLPHFPTHLCFHVRPSKSHPYILVYFFVLITHSISLHQLLFLYISISHTGYIPLSLSTCLSPKLCTSQQESRDAECWAHKFCPVWNRRWLPRTAGRFFITGSFLVPSTATTTCHQTHTGLRVYVYVFETWRSKCMAAAKKTEGQKWIAEKKYARKKGWHDEKWSGEVHSFVKWWWWFEKRQQQKIWGYLLTRLTCSWWEGFHDRVPTNKHNSEMTPPLCGGHGRGTAPFPKFHTGDLVSDGPSHSVLAPKGRKGYPVVRETRIWRHDKVLWDSCGLISNPHQPLNGTGRSQSVIW